MKGKYSALFCIILFSICYSFTSSYAQSVSIEPAFSETIEDPLGIEYSHEGSSLLYIVRKEGYVEVKDLNDPEAPSANFIDVSEKVGDVFGELGLLGLAFSPGYPEDETFYLYYTFQEDDNYYSTLARYKAPGGVADLNNEERLFVLLQPQDNHNGGQITFGPDGYLYVGLGDGGRDSRNLAQDTEVLNGSILRIDVSTDTGYSIPPDNPFVEDPDVLDEIYAWGFRNPWRMSFDPVTRHLWVADVGQKDLESIHIVEKGKNYGWPIIEGSECYPIGSDCDKTGLELPLFEYSYGDEMGKSITGGYVYRGKNNPSLYGKYIYGDFITGKIWALSVDHETLEVEGNEELYEGGIMIPAFGVDSRNELYILSWGNDASIYRLVPEAPGPPVDVSAERSGNEEIEISWQTGSTIGVEQFKLYKGPTPQDLTLLATVPSVDSDYRDSVPEDGVVFYAISSVNDGEETDLSDIVSYFHSVVSFPGHWSLVSLPLQGEELSPEGAALYGFNKVYTIESNLVPGTGYWMRNPAGSEVMRSGKGLQRVSADLEPGWNLIGGLILPVDVQTIDDPDGILTSTPVFGFNGTSYADAQHLDPLNGYWIFAENSGQISYEINTGSTDAKVVSPKNSLSDTNNSSGRILFRSETGQAELEVASGTLTSKQKNHYRLPPVGPAPLLDVRTADGFGIADQQQTKLQLTAAEYPVQITYEASGRESMHTTYRLVLQHDGDTEERELNENNQITFHKEYDLIEFIQTEKNEELVRETKLLPSYPNPFNPITNLNYRLSDNLQVELVIYDAAGRHVSTLVNEEQQAGQYTIPFDGSGFASGIYFVRFKAGDYLRTQKLTLIK